MFKRTFALLLGTATILSMSVTGVAAETAGPKAENSYEKSPKEVLFLKGLQETFKIDGKTFTLYDINSDEKDELFIETETKGGSYQSMVGERINYHNICKSRAFSKKKLKKTVII